MSPFILSALALGILSSLHCLGMCGPLVIGILPGEASVIKKTWILVLYHSGRLMIYGILGVLAGLIGQKLFMPNFQQSLSIALGCIVLIWVITKYLSFKTRFQFNFISRTLNSWLGQFLSISNNIKYLLLGGLNGLLPCGMVYIAMAGAFSLNEISSSFLFMVFFGMGTLPLLVLTSGVGLYLKAKARKTVEQLRPVFLVCFAGLLILRGLNLGIPYVSPKTVKVAEHTEMECCKKK